MFLIPGSKINNLNVLEKIGEGGMGEVYLAEDDFLGRKVALKVLNPLLTSDEQFVERFKLEAKVQASLNNPQIVQLYSFFIFEDKYIMVLEYADGITLKQLIQKTGPIPEERTMKIFNQICAGIQYAHNKGIIHRDIKPSNIMIDAQDQTKIMDFGIAKIMGDKGMTRTGAKMGTLYYMSAEQVRAHKDIDNRTDIYSLGITLFEMLTGKLPFDTDTESDFEVMNQIVNQDLPDPKSFYPFISDHTLHLVKQMTKKKKEERLNHLSVLPSVPSPEKKQISVKIAAEAPQKYIPHNDNMVFVEGGSFQRGSAKITVSSFLIGKYPVTQKEWTELIDDNPSRFKGDKRPVEQITWYQAVEFCNLLSQKEGLIPAYTINGTRVSCDWESDGYRLLTEAEWEFAARGGILSKGYIYSGSDTLDEVGWYWYNSSKQTHEVGQKKVNELGIYDMSGNVWEWCWDNYGDYAYEQSINPRGSHNDSRRVNRGGSWRSVDDYCQVCRRDDEAPIKTFHNLGFRFARSVR